MKTKLAVMESRYWDEGNHSIKPLFELIVSMLEETHHPDDFRYDMFVDRSSLLTLIKDYQRCGIEYVYMASHGKKNPFITSTQV